MKRTFISELINGIFILLFVYTAVSKLVDFENFRHVLSKSPLIGTSADKISWMLPLLELFVAGLLFIPKARIIGMQATVGLMSVFTLYVGYMLLTLTDLPCSCGGILKEFTWQQHLIANVLLLILSILGLLLLTRPNFLLRNKNKEVSRKPLTE
jgi:hypothetical protein